MFIDRKDELNRLEQLYGSKRAELFILYGRRRVGKTYLVREFSGRAIRFELTGMHGVSMRDQLGNFATALARAKPIHINFLNGALP